jgi:hypothetical protein
MKNCDPLRIELSNYQMEEWYKFSFKCNERQLILRAVAVIIAGLNSIIRL